MSYESAAQSLPRQRTFVQRHRPTQQPSLKRSVESRADRIHLRNRVLVARLYYWQEIMRRRTDDVMIILSENEFFVDERTIQNALVELADYYTDLCRRHVTARQLQRKYPSFKF